MKYLVEIQQYSYIKLLPSVPCVLAINNLDSTKKSRKSQRLSILSLLNENESHSSARKDSSKTFKCEMFDIVNDTEEQYQEGVDEAFYELIDQIYEYKQKQLLKKKDRNIWRRMVKMNFIERVQITYSMLVVVTAVSKGIMMMVYRFFH